MLQGLYNREHEPLLPSRTHHLNVMKEPFPKKKEVLGYLLSDTLVKKCKGRLISVRAPQTRWDIYMWALLCKGQAIRLLYRWSGGGWGSIGEG
jgi:hypothetical protein